MFGTSLAKKPRAKPPIGLILDAVAASNRNGTTSASDVPMRSHTSGVVARDRLFKVASTMNSWRSSSSASLKDA